MEQLSEEVSPRRYASGVYARWFIQSVISELEAGAERQDILLRYNIRPGTFDDWVRHHASPAYRNKRKIPSGSLRDAIVRSVLSGRMTVQEAKASCNIKLDKTIRIWIRDYQQRKR